MPFTCLIPNLKAQRLSSKNMIYYKNSKLNEPQYPIYYLDVTWGGKTREAKALRNISANSALRPPIPSD